MAAGALPSSLPRRRSPHLSTTQVCQASPEQVRDLLGDTTRPAAAAAAAAADAEAPKRRGGSAGGGSLHHDPLKQVTQLAGVEAKQSGGIASGVLHAYFRAFGWRLLGW